MNRQSAIVTHNTPSLQVRVTGDKQSAKEKQVKYDLSLWEHTNHDTDQLYIDRNYKSKEYKDRLSEKIKEMKDNCGNRGGNLPKMPILALKIHLYRGSPSRYH